jgi:L-iditol 2-dehydrogenase
VAALAEPFACVLRGQNALHIKPADIVLVMGAGPIGVMHIKLARARGAGRIVVSEPAPHRLEQAKRMGADRVVDPTSQDLNAILAGESGGHGADVIIVAAPSTLPRSPLPGCSQWKDQLFRRSPKDGRTLR